MEEKELEIKILSTLQTIDAVILGELKQIIYTEGAPYIKFLLFAGIIEYLGACLDSNPFIKEKLSEERFNNALKKLFPTKYKAFSNAGSSHYLYEGFRCNMVHRLVPRKFAFTTRKEAIEDGNNHLKPSCTDENNIILVLEDFYDDIEKAAKKLKKLFDQGKAPKSKAIEGQIKISGIKKK